MVSEEKRKVVFYLDGELDMALSSELYEKVHEISKQPGLVILDFSSLDNIQISATEYLPRVFSLASNENLTIGICNLSESINSQIEIFYKDHPVSLYASLEEAKEGLEINSKDQDHVGTFTTEPILIPDTILHEPKIVRCLQCNVKLRVKSPGKFQCPACKFQFTVQKNMEIVSKVSKDAGNL